MELRKNILLSEAIKKHPIIVLDSDYIILNTTGTVTIPKNEIEHIEITYLDGLGTS